MSATKPVGWRHLVTNGVEEIWAYAEVRWLSAEEPPDVWQITRFDGLGDDGDCYMGIHLDHPVLPGDVTTNPISFYAAQRPFDQFLQIGATFSVCRSGLPNEPKEPVAEGKVVSVQRCLECLPGSLFHSTLEACQEPTEAVMRQALQARENLSPAAGDYINYLAGFTHYSEAAPILAEFDLQVSGQPPRLIDASRRSVHFKVLLQDYHLPGLDRVPLARRYGSPIFINHIHDREPDGSWVVEWPRHPTYQEFLAWHAEIRHGMIESVQTIRGPREAPDGSRIVFHADRLPMRNIVANRERMLCNVSAVIGTAGSNARDPYDFSFQRLADEPAVWESLSNAFWLLVENEDTQIGTTFLDRIGAEYRVVPNDEARDDYLEQLMDTLTARLQ